MTKCYVSYAYKSPDGFGFSAASFDTKLPLTDPKQIHAIAADLEKQYSKELVIIGVVIFPDDPPAGATPATKLPLDKRGRKDRMMKIIVMGTILMWIGIHLVGLALGLSYRETLALSAGMYMVYLGIRLVEFED